MALLSEPSEALKSGLSQAWCPETAWPPMRESWTKANPAHGQCLVTALIVRREWGGHLVMGNAHVPGQTDPVLHFRNRLKTGDLDLTWSQFPEGTVFEPLDVTEPQNRDLYNLCLGDPDTRARYELLSKKVYLQKHAQP